MTPLEQLAAAGIVAPDLESGLQAARVLAPEVWAKLQQPYAEIEAVNISTLKAMEISPLHYKHGLTHPRADTDAMALGRLMHCMVFEPEKVDGRYAVWDGGRRDPRSKEWQAFLAENAGKEILRAPEDFERAEAVRDAVLSHPVASHYLRDGRAEQALTWTDAATGIACKGRADWITPTHRIVDLKTTRDISARSIARTTVGLHYHAQAAFYCDGYQAMTKAMAAFVWVFVEANPPHDVAVYTAPEAIIVAGRELYRGWLETLASCRASDVWPGIAPIELEMELPAWALHEPAAEFGLTIGGQEVTI